MYVLIYWLPNQSKLFSDPQRYATDDIYQYEEALEIAYANKYEIEFVGYVAQDK